MSGSRGYNTRRRRPKYTPTYSTAAVEDITRLAERTPTYSTAAVEDIMKLAERTVDAAIAAVRSAAYPAPSVSFVHPELATSSVHPEPAMSFVYPEPATSFVHPEPAMSFVHPEPATSFVHPEPAMSFVHPEPATSSVHPEPAMSFAHPEPAASFTHPVLAYSAPPSRNRKKLDPNSKEFIPPMKLLAKSADAIIDESADYSIWLNAATRPAVANLRSHPVPAMQYPAVALTHLLPYCLQDGHWKTGIEIPSWAHPGAFNCWLTLALLESDCLRLLHVDAVVADDLIAQYSDDKLWRCGAALARRAPCQGPGYTTYHRLVMCVAEQMCVRGLPVA